MNSFLGNFPQLPTSMMNSAQMPSILMQAFGAAMRGETPQSFMANLANQHPQLRQYDLNNLQSTAQQLCSQNGANIDDAVNKINSIGNTLMR